ncbi:helix-turn-helix domain-containing protein [Streptomyces sp. NPDC058287]|uniref:helix-turn-helix domain-containing protein n=1 Tax=Streptomyces sp. NPDC058287 TaxID=3346423 RepID=UPI0036E84DE6
MKAMTAEELAGAAGTTKAQILAYENGHRVPEPPRIKTLARALHIHPQLLMNPEKRGNWAIADVRRGCGLRADDVVRELGVSPKVYRRFETEGIVPSRRPRFLDEVAAVFGITRQMLEQAIDKTPAVLQRQRRAAVLVGELAARYVLAAGPWLGPDLSDPELIELATAYGRPLHRTRRVMTYELGELRQRRVRALRESVIADFDTDRDRQMNARLAVDRWNELFTREQRRIPLRLEQFHRNAQPSDVWQLLVVSSTRMLCPGSMASGPSRSSSPRTPACCLHIWSSSESLTASLSAGSQRPASPTSPPSPGCTPLCTPLPVSPCG